MNPLYGYQDEELTTTLLEELGVTDDELTEEELTTLELLEGVIDEELGFELIETDELITISEEELDTSELLEIEEQEPGITSEELEGISTELLRVLLDTSVEELEVPFTGFSLPQAARRRADAKTKVGKEIGLMDSPTGDGYEDSKSR